MARPKFDDFPFNSRSDLTPYLVHLTKNTTPDDNYSAYDNLVSIPHNGEIWGSGRGVPSARTSLVASGYERRWQSLSARNSRRNIRKHTVQDLRMGIAQRLLA